MDFIRDDDVELGLPPEGHPLRMLGIRLGELLDEDQFAQCERLLLDGWDRDRIDRKTGSDWRENSSLEVWFPFSYQEINLLRETLEFIAGADYRKWEELSSPDEFVRWAKSRANHALILSGRDITDQVMDRDGVCPTCFQKLRTDAAT